MLGFVHVRVINSNKCGVVSAVLRFERMVENIPFHLVFNLYYLDDDVLECLKSFQYV